MFQEKAGYFLIWHQLYELSMRGCLYRENNNRTSWDSFLIRHQLYYHTWVLSCRYREFQISLTRKTSLFHGCFVLEIYNKYTDLNYIPMHYYEPVYRRIRNSVLRSCDILAHVLIPYSTNKYTLTNYPLSLKSLYYTTLHDISLNKRNYMN